MKVKSYEVDESYKLKSYETIIQNDMMENYNKPITSLTMTGKK